MYMDTSILTKNIDFVGTSASQDNIRCHNCIDSEYSGG